MRALNSDILILPCFLSMLWIVFWNWLPFQAFFGADPDCFDPAISANMDTYFASVNLCYRETGQDIKRRLYKRE